MNHVLDLLLLLWAVVMLVIVLPIAVYIQRVGKKRYGVDASIRYAMLFSFIIGLAILLPVIVLETLRIYPLTDYNIGESVSAIGIVQLDKGGN